MKVYYNDEVDALYLKLSERKPEGVVELAEGINFDTTGDGKLAGIEILKLLKRSMFAQFCHIRLKSTEVF